MKDYFTKKDKLFLISDDELVEKTECSLKVGDRLRLLDSFVWSNEITYAGMPNENTFSFIYSESQVFLKTRGNLFFP